MPLTPLSAYQPPPYRPKLPVVIALVLVAVVYAASMLLDWVGVITAAGSYVIVTGLHQANWMLLVAAILLAVALRLSVSPPSGYTRFLFVVLDFYVPLGLYIEYIDNLGRAESYTTTPYLGPGFFLAFGATIVLIASTVFGWRPRDEWRETPTAGCGPGELILAGALASDRSARLRIAEALTEDQQQLVRDARILEQGCLEIPDRQ